MPQNLLSQTEWVEVGSRGEGEALPLVTTHRSTQWAMAIIDALKPEADSFDFDYIERLIQAVRDDAVREALLKIERAVVEEIR